MSIVTRRDVTVRKKMSFKIGEPLLKEVEALQSRIEKSSDMELHLDEAMETHLKKLVTQANKEFDKLEKETTSNSKLESLSVSD